MDRAQVPYGLLRDRLEDKMDALVVELGEQMQEGRALDEEIKRQLLKVGFVVSDKAVEV